MFRELDAGFWPRHHKVKKSPGDALALMRQLIDRVESLQEQLPAFQPTPEIEVWQKWLSEQYWYNDGVTEIRDLLDAVAGKQKRRLRRREAMARQLVQEVLGQELGLDTVFTLVKLLDESKKKAMRKDPDRVIGPLLSSLPIPEQVEAVRNTLTPPDDVITALCVAPSYSKDAEGPEEEAQRLMQWYTTELSPPMQAACQGAQPSTCAILADIVKAQDTILDGPHARCLQDHVAEITTLLEDKKPRKPSAEGTQGKSTWTKSKRSRCPRRTALHLVLSLYEDSLLGTIEDVAAEHGWEVGVLLYDGLLLRKVVDGVPASNEEAEYLRQKIESRLSTTWNIDMPVVWKQWPPDSAPGIWQRCKELADIASTRPRLAHVVF